MSTRNTESEQDRIEKVAEGFNQTFLRLVYLSPLALIIILAAEIPQQYDFLTMLAGIVAATGWTLYSFYS